MTKTSVSFPGNPTIWVKNNLRAKKIHVIISPSEDFRLAKLFTAFASLASGAVSAASASGLAALVRTMSLAKDSKKILEDLKAAVPKSSVTILPGGGVEVYNAILSDPLMWTNPVGIVSIFGGKGLNILVVDEDFKRVVMFDTAFGKEYFVNEEGVGDPMHRWNAGGLRTGVITSAPPSTVLAGDKMLMFYRDSDGNGIFISEFQEGGFKPHGRKYVGHDTNEGVGATMRDGKFFAVARDINGEQMFSLRQIDTDFMHNVTHKWMGIDIQGRPSVAAVGSWVLAVAKHCHGNGALWAMLTPRDTGEYGYTKFDTEYPPAVAAFNKQFYMVYVDPNTKQMRTAFTKNGSKWYAGVPTGHYTNAGPALTVYKEKLYIFYRDPNGNGVFYTWTDDGQTFHVARNVYFGLDVDGEPTAAPMPGENNGILIAGQLPLSGVIDKIIDKISSKSREITYVILHPDETPGAKLAGGKKNVKVKKKKSPAKKKQSAAKKKTVAKKKKAVAKKRVVKKTVSPKGKKAAKTKPVKVKRKTTKKVVVKSRSTAKVKKTRKAKPVVSKRKPVVKKKVVRTKSSAKKAKRK